MGVTAITNTIVNKGFPNGTEWTRVLTDTYQTYAITKIDGYWYRCCSNGIYRSEDAINWIQWALSGETCCYLYYNKGLFLVATLDTYRYSEDNGATWIQASVSKTKSVYKSMEFQQGIFSNGTKWSLDGKTWENCIPMLGEVGLYRNMFYAGGLWFKMEEPSSNTYRLYYSYDGKSWTRFDGGIASNNRVTDVLYCDGIWYFMTIRALYSTKDLQTVDTTVTYNQLSGSAFLISGQNNIFLRNGQYLYYSTDKGATWINPPSVSGLTMKKGVLFYVNHVYIASGSLRTFWYTYYSTNGVDWIKFLDTESATTVAYEDGLWVMATINSDSTENYIYTSIGWQPT